MSNIIEPDTKFTPKVESSLEPQIDWAHGSIVLGRDRQNMEKFGLDGTMELGLICERQTTGASLFGYKVLFDYKFPHIIFICGKRGSGKSYTLGVIVEELGRSNSGIGTVVIDPLGTFWSMKTKTESKKAVKTLSKYGMYPKDFENIQVLAPIGFYEDLKTSVDGPFSIAVSDLSVDDWCLVFDINRFKTQGLLIGDVLDKINKGYDAQVGNLTKKIPAKHSKYTIGDIIFCIQNDIGINSSLEGYALATKRSVIARFRAAGNWGIFSVEGTPIQKISVRNKITILDVSHSKLGSSRRALIVGILARKILEARIDSSRKAEVSSMGLGTSTDEIIPVTWLVIDEAHLLLPSAGKTAATESLIEYAKLGRKPGCGLVFATQRPSSTNDEILSQVDTIIGHNLALEDDIASLRRRIPAKMPKLFSTSDFIRGIPVGVCLFADQKTQRRTMLAQIRPRLTHHSGRAAIPKPMTQDLLPEGGDDLITSAEPEQLKAGLDTTSKQEDPDPAIALHDIMDTTTELPFTVNDEMKPDFDEEAFAVAGTTIDQSTFIESHGGTIGKELLDETKLQQTTTSSLPVADLDWGGAYIIFSKGSTLASKLFVDITQQHSARPLTITRVHPDKISLGGIQDACTNIWLSKSAEEYSISPGNITKLAHVINEHLKSSEKSVILLDGVEYLINNNDFQKILKFLEAIHEMVVLNSGIILVPLNPSIFEQKHLELLEKELGNIITDPELGGLLTRADDEVKKDLESEAGAEVGARARAGDESSDDGVISSELEPSRPAGKLTTTKSAEIDDLRKYCAKLGLKTTGSIKDLKKRLLAYESGTIFEHDHEREPKHEHKPAVEQETKTKDKTRTATKQQPEKLSKDEKELIKTLAGEHKELLSERKRLQNELEKLKKVEWERKVSLEKQKISAKHKKLEAEKKKLENERAKLQNQLEKLQNQTLLELKRRELTKKQNKKMDNLQIRRPHRPKDNGRRPGRSVKPKAGLKMIMPDAEVIPEAIPIRKQTPDKQTKKEMMLVVRPILKGNTVKEYAARQLKTTIFGRSLETLSDIRPVYLQLLRVYVKSMRGTIITKEQSGTFFWDTVTGEIILKAGNTLKRSKGISTMIKLTPTQAKVLASLSTRSSNDVMDIYKDIKLPEPAIKRSLTALKKKSLITEKLHPETQMKLFKRNLEIKFPKKLEKIDVEMPRIIPGEVLDSVLKPRFKISELEKLLTELAPNTRIVNAEEVYYPYFQVRIMSKTGPRAVLLDAVTGLSDEILTEMIQYQ